MYKLVAIDMDGTLLTDDKLITKENIEAIKEAKKQGCVVVINTGRPYEGILETNELLKVENIKDYYLNFNGSLVQDDEFKIIHEEVISGKDIKFFQKEAERLNTHLHAFTKTYGLITLDENPYTDIEVRINKISVDVKDFKEVADDEVVIKAMFVDEKSKLDNVFRELDKSIYENYQVVRSSEVFLEVLNQKADKFTGVLALADYLGIKNEEIITIGDAGNDYSMVKNAGLGVAMKNGFKEVIEVAKYVTENDNNNSGVAEVINKFVLNK